MAGLNQERSFAGGRPVIAPIPLGPGSEWVLADGGLLSAPPGLRSLARRRTRDLVAAYGPARAGAGPAGFAVVRVPAVDPLLGRAVLHYSAQSGTVIYCQESQVTDWVHPWLEPWLAAALTLARSLPRAAQAAAPRVRLALVQHDQMPQLMGCPLVIGRVRARTGNITAWVCDQQLTAELARWLGALCTAHGHLLSVMSPRA